ncbi:MAG: ATP-binding protein [Pseudomonadota bacterium]
MNKWTVKTRTLFLGLAPALFMFLVITGYFVSSRLDEINQQLNQRGELIVQQLAPALEYGVIIGNKQVLNNVLNAVINEDDVAFAEVINIAGVPLVEQKNPRFDKEADEEKILVFRAPIYQEDIDLEDEIESALADETESENTETIVASNHLLRDSRPTIGEVVVGLTEEGKKQKQEQIVVFSFLLGILTLLLSAALAWFIGQAFSNPIIQLSSKVNEIKSGNLNVHIPKISGGEIGSLEMNIDAMAKSLLSAQIQERAYMEDLLTARQAAETANRAKSEFLANMSHELRTPMNGTLGMLQLLQETQLTSTQREYLSAASESTEHLLRVVNDILDFSKIEDGRLELESIFINLKQLVKRCSNSFYNEAKRKGLTLVAEFEGELQNADIATDPTRLRQVLVNLIGNAIKFTHQGKVEISCQLTRTTEDFLHLSIVVEDTGIGIKKEQIPTIFHAFTQADGSMARRYGGTGLGLTITRQLVELMGGRIQVSSEEAVGSRFNVIFELPYEFPEHETEPPNIRFTFPKLSGHVLLVEDNRVNQMVTRGLLCKMGVSVDTADDGIKALDRYHESQYDLIVMDCQMPNMDGFETTQKIRELEQEELKKTPIIALTANAMDGDKERCIAAGMNDYLSKPINKELLADVLKKWLEVAHT